MLGRGTLLHSQAGLGVRWRGAGRTPAEDPELFHLHRESLLSVAGGWAEAIHFCQSAGNQRKTLDPSITEAAPLFPLAASIAT